MKNQNQLKRTISNLTYYCEAITDSYEKALQIRNTAKFAKFKARLIKLSENRKVVFGVFVS